MTVYAVGLDNDKTLMRFIGCAQELGEAVELVNLHDLLEAPWCWSAPAALGPSMAGTRSLDPNAAFYARLVDLSPVLIEPDAGRWRSMLTGVAAFLESAPGIVVNRPGSQIHNAAKPLHECWLARRGFHVPPALTTADPTDIEAFVGRHGRVIVKTLCGIRATAQVMTWSDLTTFRPEQGPIHLQKVIDGFDVRVHMVGAEAHAERIDSDGPDYRERSAETRHTAHAPPADLVARMASASAEMGLAFTGWDFKVDSDGVYWCLEANPMPGYDVYDRRCDGAISRALLEHLRHGDPH